MNLSAHADVDLSITQASQQALTIDQKIDRISQQFLGVPYGNSPLGEASGIDADPRFRTDAFDCTTLVETTLALSLSTTLDDAKILLDRIRYQNQTPHFATRHHITSADWTPHLIASGWVKDASAEILRKAGLQQALKHASTMVDRKAWFKKIHGLAIEKAPEIVTIQYISIPTILHSKKVQAAMPTVAIVNIVRPNWQLAKIIGTNLHVSHQGLLFNKSGELWFRHASTTAKKVVDVKLVDYLEQFENHKTIKGIQVLEIL